VQPCLLLIICRPDGARGQENLLADSLRFIVRSCACFSLEKTPAAAACARAEKKNIDGMGVERERQR
jgi:hypothetical protein